MIIKNICFAFVFFNLERIVFVVLCHFLIGVVVSITSCLYRYSVIRLVLTAVVTVMGACLSSCVRYLLGIESEYEEIPDRDIDGNRASSTYSSSPKQRVNEVNGHSGTENSSYQAEFFKKYDLKEVIGVGSTGTCHRCRRKSDSNEFACKIIDKRQIEANFTGLLDQFYTEIRVLKDLKHPNVIQLEDVFETADRIFIVMEVMNGGELFDYVVEKGTLSEAEAAVIVRKITSAVAHMHSKSIIHRDLKPENLLLTEKGPNAEVKLIDFGLAKVILNCNDILMKL